MTDSNDQKTLVIISDMLGSIWAISHDHIEDHTLRHFITDRIDELQDAFIDKMTTEERKCHHT